MERSIDHVKISAFLQYENMIALNGQPFGDEVDRHLRALGKRIVENACDLFQVIDDDEGNVQIRWKNRQQLRIFIDVYRRASKANDWKI